MEDVASENTSYQPGDEITLQVADINVSQTVSKTLYAKWEANTFDVSYNPS